MKKLFSIVLAIATLASTLNACSFFQKEMNKENENSRYYEQLGQAVEVSKDTLILRTPTAMNGYGVLKRANALN